MLFATQTAFIITIATRRRDDWHKVPPKENYVQFSFTCIEITCELNKIEHFTTREKKSGKPYKASLIKKDVYFSEEIWTRMR